MLLSVHQASAIPGEIWAVISVWGEIDMETGEEVTLQFCNWPQVSPGNGKLLRRLPIAKIIGALVNEDFEFIMTRNTLLLDISKLVVQSN
jgi:hypothetical protein